MKKTPLEVWASPSQSAKFEDTWNRKSLKSVAELLGARGVNCLLVGGVVRDLVLDAANDDVDLVVDATPDQLFSQRNHLAKKTKATAVPLDRERGILRLVFGPGDELDLVSRKGDTLLEDLGRRDFTVNAMALDAAGTLVDPFNGLQDLNDRVLRFVSEDSFTDDPLRVVRGVRFAAQLQATIEAKTFEAMLVAAPLLARVAGERISTELRKFFPKARAVDMSVLYQLKLAEHLFGFSATSQALLCSARPQSYSHALAVWLDAHKEQVKLVAERLRLSRSELRYLEHYWAGERWLPERGQSVEIGDIYELSCLAKEAFLDLAETLQHAEYPSALNLASRQQILREARGEGTLNWDAFPWNGHQLAETLGKDPGPWMGAFLQRAKKAWACGEIRSREELKKLIVS